jgi:hypothetical protein
MYGETFQPRDVSDREGIKSQIQLGQFACREDRIAGATLLALHDDADVAILPAELAARRVLVLPGRATLRPPPLWSIRSCGIVEEAVREFLAIHVGLS